MCAVLNKLGNLQTTRHLAVLVLAIGWFYAQGPELVRHPAERLGDAMDASLNAWIMAWDTEAILHRGGRVWDAPIFHPAANTLALSEPMFGNLWIALPVNALTGNPVLAANCHILAAFVLSMYSTWLLVRRWTGHWLAGVVAGLLFSFNPVRWGQLEHMQLLPFYWAPLALLGLHSYLRWPSPRAALGTAAALVAQYYTSINLGTILLAVLLVFAGCHILLERRGWDRFFFVRSSRARWAVILSGVFLAAALFPLMRPYTRILRDWNFARTESDCVTHSCEPLSFVVPPASSGRYHEWHDVWAGRIAHPLSL
ncbi:MAG: hypothetical protein ACJ8F7_21790, partial [Gemmataceae bacterium]